jgi:serine phosphatase RsbU (regulator of sigma subunit)
VRGALINSPTETAYLDSYSLALEESPVELKAKVLAVDDQPNNLLALEATLTGLGVELVKAHSGKEALRCLLHNDFALILMDVMMPHMDGFETAELIRQRQRCRHTPIIFLTAFENAELQMFKGYSLGAVDYLCKPIVPAVLRSKVAVFVDIFQKSDQVQRQAERLRQIEQRQHQRQLEEAKERWQAERLREEIRIARQIQQKLFPAAPLPLAGFDISGASFPAEATGGDYFDYIPMPDGSLGVVIGDVSGHGFGPALLMAETRAYLRALMLTLTDAGEIVSLVNRALAADAPDDRFTTLLLVRLDPRTRRLAYVSAGHPTGYILDSSGRLKLQLNSTGMPLAIEPDVKFAAAPALTLEDGDLVLLITDGLTEAHSPDENLMGLERVLASVRANRERTAQEVLDALFAAVRAFCGGKAHLDDMTAIVIKVQAQGSPT